MQLSGIFSLSFVRLTLCLILPDRQTHRFSFRELGRPTFKVKLPNSGLLVLTWKILGLGPRQNNKQALPSQNFNMYIADKGSILCLVCYG